MKTAICECLR